MSIQPVALCHDAERHARRCHLADRYDGAARAIEPIRRHRNAGAQLVGRAHPHAALRLHRRRIRRGCANRPSNDVRVIDVPDDMETEDRFFDFRSHYVFGPTTNVIQVTRHLRATFDAQVCPPSDFAAARLTPQKIERDVQSQVIVKANRG
jgi:hypothetical protein